MATSPATKWARHIPKAVELKVSAASAPEEWTRVMLLQRSHFAIKKCPARHPNRANAASPCLLRDVVSLQRFRASRVRGPSLRHFFEGKLPDRVSGLGGQFFGLGSPPPVILRARDSVPKTDCLVRPNPDCTTFL